MRPMKTVSASILTVALSVVALPALAGSADDARAAAARGDRAAAIAAWRAAIAAEPTEASHYEALGREQLRGRDFEGAIATFRELIRTVPSHARGRYRLAFVLRKAGRLDEAATAYRSYVDASPNDPDGHFGLAKTLEKLGQNPEARAAYARYIELETRPSEVKWVEQARARVAALAPAAEPAEDVTGSERSGVESAAPDRAAGPTPATARAATPDPSSPVPVSDPVGTSDEELIEDSPVARATPAADPDAAFAAGRYAEAAAGYISRLDAGDDPTLRYRAAVAATLAGDTVLAARQVQASLGAAPANAAGRRLARATAAEMSRRRQAVLSTAGVAAALRDNRLRTAARLAIAAIDGTADPVARSALRWARGRALARLGRYDEALVELKQAARERPVDARLWAELGDVAARRGDRAAAAGFRDIAAAIAPAGHPLSGATGHSIED